MCQVFAYSIHLILSVVLKVEFITPFCKRGGPEILLPTRGGARTGTRSAAARGVPFQPTAASGSASLRGTLRAVPCGPGLGCAPAVTDGQSPAAALSPASLRPSGGFRTEVVMVTSTHMATFSLPEEKSCTSAGVVSLLRCPAGSGVGRREGGAPAPPRKEGGGAAAPGAQAAARRCSVCCSCARIPSSPWISPRTRTARQGVTSTSG